ncbi:MAG: hypothetical protein QRY72_00275 [Candidatus Rhabdochlamydia sp.]
MSHSVLSSRAYSSPHEIPCLPGYTMGGIVLTSELQIPSLEQQKYEFENAISKAEIEKDQIKDNTGIEIQTKLVVLSRNINQLREKLKEIENKIQSYQQDKESLSSFETMLPIDYKRSGVEYRNTADESEKMHFIVIKKQSAKSQLTKFTEHLTQMRYLPSVIDLIEQVSQAVLDQDHDQEVCLLGCFITTSRVRVMDPIVMRTKACLSQQLKQLQTASKFSVISEAVLGGAFIGFGTNITNNSISESKNQQEIKKITSSMHAFSFISQGAIPTTEHFNLWEAYNSWKAKILKDQHCGFPIAFKVRKLTDILEENGLGEEESLEQ